jgi:hypothetical protein
MLFPVDARARPGTTSEESAEIRDPRRPQTTHDRLQRPSLAHMRVLRDEEIEA